MPDQQLVDYITASLAKGASRDAIMLQLSKAGWQDTSIQDALDTLTHTSDTFLPPMPTQQQRSGVLIPPQVSITAQGGVLPLSPATAPAYSSDAFEVDLVHARTQHPTALPDPHLAIIVSSASSLSLSSKQSSALQAATSLQTKPEELDNPHMLRVKAREQAHDRIRTEMELRVDWISQLGPLRWFGQVLAGHKTFPASLFFLVVCALLWLQPSLAMFRVLSSVATITPVGVQLIIDDVWPADFHMAIVDGVLQTNQPSPILLDLSTTTITQAIPTFPQSTHNDHFLLAAIDTDSPDPGELSAVYPSTLIFSSTHLLFSPRTTGEQNQPFQTPYDSIGSIGINHEVVSAIGAALVNDA